MHSIFTSEPSHMFHLGISKLVKDCKISFLSSETKVSHPTRRRDQCKPLGIHSNYLLRGSNALVTAMVKEYPAAGLHIGSSINELSFELNGVFMSDGLLGMLEGKEFLCLDMLFSFVNASIDRVIGCDDTAPLTSVHVKYSDSTDSLTAVHRGKGWHTKGIKSVLDDVYSFKKSMVGLFHESCPTELHRLKFHMLHHVVDDLERFGTLHVLDELPYEH